MAVIDFDDKAMAYRRRIFQEKLQHPGRLYSPAEYMALVGEDLIHTTPNPFEIEPSQEEIAAREDMELCQRAAKVAGEAYGAAWAECRQVGGSGDRARIADAEARRDAALEVWERAREECTKAAGKYNRLRQQRTDQVAKAQHLAGLAARGQDQDGAKEERRAFLRGLIERGEKIGLAIIRDRIPGAVR